MLRSVKSVRPGSIGSGEKARLDSPGPRLRDRALRALVPGVRSWCPRRKGGDLALVGIDADDFVTFLGEGHGQRQADTTEPCCSDLHVARSRSEGRRGVGRAGAFPSSPNTVYLSELAALPCAAVVVEERYGTLVRQPRVRAGWLCELVAQLQVRYPGVPVVFAVSRELAEDWTHRFLAAAFAQHAPLP